MVIALAAATMLVACGGNGARDVGSVEVWAVGDGPSAKRDAREVAQMIAEAEPDRLLYLGDVYGDYSERFEETFGAVGLSDITLPTPGNHEWPSQRSGYLRYWQKVKGGERLRPYYSTELGGWQVLSINTEISMAPSSPQLRWLRRQLGDGTCRLAFMHRPRWSAGRHGDQREVAPVWDALSGHATLVLSGHDHTMQRLAPRDGLTQLIAGAGGRNLYSLDQSDPRLRFGNNTEFGALRLRLSPGLAAFNFVTVDGEQLDSGQLSCQEKNS